ncbi:hypothetical protein A2U01_0107318, partial [Trifolium medium]|nr:hypothetical protein [Trifolium medium]
ATAAANMKPELKPISAVPILSAAALSDEARKMNAIGVGISAMVSHPVLAKYTLLQMRKKLPSVSSHICKI